MTIEFVAQPVSHEDIVLPYNPLHAQTRSKKKQNLFSHCHRIQVPM